MMIALFLHPLNYLHVPNVLIGILFFKASIVGFHKEMRMVGGVLCLSSSQVDKSYNVLTAHHLCWKAMPCSASPDGGPPLRLTKLNLI